MPVSKTKKAPAKKPAVKKAPEKPKIVAVEPPKVEYPVLTTDNLGQRIIRDEGATIAYSGTNILLWHILQELKKKR